MADTTNGKRRRAGAAPARKKKTIVPKSRRNLIRAVGFLLASLLVLFLAITVYANSRQTVFPHVDFMGRNLSGKSEEEVRAVVSEYCTPDKFQNGTLSFRCEGKTERIPAAILNPSFDTDQTTAQIINHGKEGGFFAKGISFLVHLFHTQKCLPEIRYDKDLLTQKVDAFLAPFETEPVGYTFRIMPEEVELIGPVNGVKVDRPPVWNEAEKQLKTSSFTEIALVPVVTRPEELKFDEFYTWLTSPAQDAYYEKGADGKVVVHPEKRQCTVEKSTVEQAVRDLKSSTDNRITFPVSTTVPKVTEEDLKNHLYSEKLGSYTTYYSGSAARCNNVQVATSRINGIEMMPGDEFSYDKTILPRKSENGYQAAPVYIGNKVESGMGGGICQPSSTLYCAALYANLEILERHNHSMIVGYLPAGLDATIAEGSLDMRFRNNTPYPIKLVGSATGGVLTFTIWGYNPEHISVEIQRGGGDMSYTATRIVKQDGKEIKRESLSSSSYVPHESPTPAPKPTESATPKETSNPTASAAPEPAKTPAPQPTPKPAPQATAKSSTTTIEE